jgi:hypothetical protein
MHPVARVSIKYWKTSVRKKKTVLRTEVFQYLIITQLSFFNEFHEISAMIKLSTLNQFSSVCEVLGLPLCFSVPSFSVARKSSNLFAPRRHLLLAENVLIMNTNYLTNLR